VKFFLGIFGQFNAKVKQFVLAGLATTTTLQFLLATSFKAFAYSL